jgi:orotidine-5'-phosphate decarboxylase
MHAPAPVPYRDRLATLVEQRGGSRLCLGLDPSPSALDLVGGMGSSRADRGRAIARFGELVIGAAAEHAVAIKPQLAWYEAAGVDGIAALADTVAAAREAGLLVVLDGKRGDIPHSAAAYADAWLGDDAASGICGDALTVNASPGTDSLAAMAEVAHARGCDLYALVLTSNPGAEGLQGVRVTTAGDGDAAGQPWWQLVARAVPECGVGAVVGATQSHALPALRAALPDAPLLVPGIGAQGGSVSALDALDVAGTPPTLVPVSRSLLPSREEAAGRSPAALGEAIEAAAAELASSLGRRAAVDVGAAHPLG